MKVQQIMRDSVRTCHVANDLATATSRMWESDCGALPVVTSTGAVVGMLTDRDIAIALGTRNRAASDVAVGEVMTTDVYACAPGDDIRVAMELMAERRIRRLPVVDEGGAICGILSIDDLALNSEGGPLTDLTYADVGWVLRAVCAPRTTKPAVRGMSSTAFRSAAWSVLSSGLVMVSSSSSDTEDIA